MKFSVKRSQIHGVGSIAAKTMKKGELIINLEGKKYSALELDKLIKTGKIGKDDDFQIDHNIFLVPRKKDSFFFNHSCNPNAGVRGRSDLIAIQDILPGEEITIDYATVSGISPANALFPNKNWKMVCNCGEKNCRGTIGNVQTLPQETLQKYERLDVLPDFIKEQLNL